MNAKLPLVMKISDLQHEIIERVEDPEVKLALMIRLNSLLMEVESL